MDKWEVDDAKKCVTACDHKDKLPKHKIVFSEGIWDVIRAMLVRYPQHEWQMVLGGEIRETTCHCTSYYIPKQLGRTATVKNMDMIDDEMIKKNKFVATIHSHVNMQTFLSTTDVDDSVMSLIDYHIVINNRQELTCVRKTKLPCGELAMVNCDPYIEGLVDLNKVEIKGTENIKIEEYGTFYPPHVKSDAPAWKDRHDRDYDDEKMTRDMIDRGRY